MAEPAMRPGLRSMRMQDCCCMSCRCCTAAPACYPKRYRPGDIFCVNGRGRRSVRNGRNQNQGWPQDVMLEDREALLRRLHELRSEHRDLDTVIARLEGSIADQLQTVRLKKRKLKLKDEVAWLESRLVPDIIA